MLYAVFALSHLIFFFFLDAEIASQIVNTQKDCASHGDGECSRHPSSEEGCRTFGAEDVEETGREGEDRW